MLKTKSGFTLVELLIVIVIIAILAAITIVAYNGIQQRATTAMLDSDLTQASKAVKLYQVANDNFPSNLATVNISNSGGVVYDYAAQAGAYCLSATKNSISRSISEGTQPGSGDCQSAFVKWTPSGGVSYDSATNQIVLSTSSSGNAVSPLIPTGGSASATITIDMYATLSSPTGGSGKSCVYLSSAYYGSDGTTLVNNTAGYTGNGNAGCYPIAVWSTHRWSTPTGPNVAYVKFVINGAPSSYTSDNHYRNVSITTN